ncbi:hypothetical protein CR513_54975, partial [Mucuna pruriens]
MPPLGFVYGDLVNELVPNIKILRQYGVPQASISLLMTNALSAAYVEHSRFVEAVMTVKEIGFSPLKTNSVIPIHVLVTMRKAVWESRFEVYERWGWNREIKCLSEHLGIIKILKSKGLLKCNMHFSSIICTTKEKFLEKFVVNFQNVLPLLPDVYRGVINPSN